MRLSGIGVSAGRCCARVYIYDRDDPAAAALGGVAHDAPTGRRLFDEAVECSRQDLIQLEGEVAERTGADAAAIFAAHRMVLDDEEWLGPIRAGVEAGEQVAAAVWRVSQDIAAVFRQMDDDYMRERATDIVDVAQRVMEHLGCAMRPGLPVADDGEVVLVAHELTPSDTVGLDPATVLGIATEVGARTSHAAILARQLGIPAAVGVVGLLTAARHAGTIAVDGDSGDCELDPSDATAREFSVVTGAAESVVTEPVVTSDGVAVAVCANVSSAAEVAGAVAKGADGVGLFRTEFLFLHGADLPGEEEQLTAYSAAAEAADGRPVVFRALDVGADKQVPGLPMPSEDNPFLGLRGIRLLLRERALFETQLRAIIRTAERHPNVSLMLPMVSDLGELRDARAIAADLGGEGLRLGTMIEVPSAVVLLRELAPLADFLSVGSNDLTAYVLAADRTNPRLGSVYDELHPAVIRVLDMIAAAAADQETPLSVCGELAGDPIAVPLLLGLGYRSLSVAPPLIPKVKAAVRSISVSEARELALRALAGTHVDEVQTILRKPARVG